MCAVASAEAIMLSGAATTLIDGKRSPYTDIQGQCAWAVSNLAKKGAEVRDCLVDDGALPPPLPLLEQLDILEKLHQNALWALNNVYR